MAGAFDGAASVHNAMEGKEITMGLMQKIEEFVQNRGLDEDDKRIKRFIEAINAKNWVKIHQLGREYDLDPAALFDNVAEAACYSYATASEPQRCSEFTALRNTLELLQYPLWADAVERRHAVHGK